MNLESLTNEVISVARAAANFIEQNVGLVNSEQIISKEKNSLVSYVDKTAEKMIVGALSEILPEAGFITEEDTVENSTNDLVWIVDPLDGTTNFLQGIPHFSVSIALRNKEDYLIGVVSDVMHHKIYHAYKGGGAFCDGNPISVSQTERMDQAVFATGFPYVKENRIPTLLNMLDSFLREARGIRRFGSAALDMTYVACGKIDGYYEGTLNIWDIAAGIVLVREAGGRISNFEGKESHPTGTNILASNEHLWVAVREIIQRSMPAAD